MTHPKESLIVDASLENGMREAMKGVSYESGSVENLPTPLKQYWRTKEREHTETELIAAGDQAVEWIEQNQNKNLKQRFLEWFK